MHDRHLMKFRLIHKLLIALFASAALVLLLIVWVAKINIGRGFEDFLAQQEKALMPEMAEELASRYAQNGSWQELQENPREFHRILNSILLEMRRGEYTGFEDGSRTAERRPARGKAVPDSGARRIKHSRAHPPPDEGALHRRVFLLDAGYRSVIGHSPRAFPKDQLIPVTVENEVVGWLGVVSPRTLLAPAERAFADRITRILWLGLALGLGVAALMAWILARHLGRPVSEAAGGIRKLASGDYSVELETRGTDEIAQLSHDVNQLAHALSENRGARQRWMAEMAHELRTPLAIIQGELEAMSDGVRPFNEASLSSINEEVGNLSQLIEDLHHLALSDSGALAYKMHSLDLAAVLESSLGFILTRASEKGLVVSTQLPAAPVLVNGDDHRLRQLVRILLDNAVLYTDAPGDIDISLVTQGDEAQLVVSDSPPGVPGSECEQLFEPLYRRENSRNRNSGGSGLGLAIARNIAEAHGGTLRANPGPLGGLEVRFTMSLQP